MTYGSRVGGATEGLGETFDKWCNAVFWGGSPDQTVSEHAALDARAGLWPGCILCAVLAVLVQWQHCSKTLDPNASTPTSAYVRAGLCFVILLGLLGSQIAHAVIWLALSIFSLFG